VDELATIRRIAAQHGVGGRVGVIFEGQSASGRPDAKVGDWRTVVDDCDLSLVHAVREAVAFGIPVHLYRTNSNNPGKGWQSAWKKTSTATARKFFTEQTKNLMSALYPFQKWLTVNWCNEDDSSMDASIRAALREAGAAWADRSSSPSGKNVRWRESHPGGYTTAATGDRRTLVVTDNGGAIRALFDGGLWDSAGPKADKCAQMAVAFIAKGQRFGLYETDDVPNLSTYSDRYNAIVAACAKHLSKGSPAIPPTTPGPGAPALSNVRGDGGNLRFKLAGWETAFKKRKTDKGKTLCGIALANKKKYEFLSTANARDGIKIVSNLKGGEYGQKLKRGELVAWSFCDLDKKVHSNTVYYPWWQADT
jgi:hypothetical protein